MNIVIRKVGNSLGIIIPKSVLDSWKVGEGDHLNVSPGGISPPPRGSTAQDALDELKRKLAAAVTASFAPRQIRAHSLANLHRWRKRGVWVSAYGEWQKIMEGADDGELFAAMLGRDERSTRLRQSAPYVGMLPRADVERLNEEAGR